MSGVMGWGVGMGLAWRLELGLVNGRWGYSLCYYILDLRTSLMHHFAFVKVQSTG
jgi:hypothetical protein